MSGALLGCRPGGLVPHREPGGEMSAPLRPGPGGCARLVPACILTLSLIGALTGFPPAGRPQRAEAVAPARSASVSRLPSGPRWGHPTAYVANGFSDSVTPIDTSDNSRGGDIPVGT